MLENINSIFILISKIFAIYFVLIAIFSIFGKKEEKQADEKLRFAALIPARNEENHISGIVDSLKNQDYPDELLDIIVIANHCTDKTVEISKLQGAYVIEAPENVKYKGGALHFAMNKLLKSKKGYDAFLVFDAGSEVSTNFVSSMNQTLCNGSRVAKSRIWAKNPEDSWLAVCYDIHFCTSNLFLNRARARIGLSARLIGTGFAVKSECLLEMGGFNTRTITEDVEFFAICAAKGEKIAFCENAIIYDEQTLDFKESLIQRKRWMSGIMQVLVLKFKNLSKGLFKKKSAKYSFDALVQLSFSYIQALLPFSLLLSMINGPSTFILKSLPIIIIKAYLYVLLIALIVLISEKRLTYSRNTLNGILLYPFFVISFIPLQTLSLFKRTIKWEEKRYSYISNRTNKMENKINSKESDKAYYTSYVKSIKKIASYARNYGISVVIDIGVFASLIFFLKPILGRSAILIASVIARIFSSLVNFSLNKLLFIGKNVNEKNFIGRYYILWAGILSLSTGITYILNDVFAITEVGAKMIADICLGLLSYQIQINWVFREDSSKKKRGLYFRIVRKILGLFLKIEIDLDEEIFMTEKVLVGHHQNFYGPITCMLCFPDSVNIWVASHLFNFKECFNMYYNFTFKKTLKVPRVLAFVISTICALLLPPLIRSAGAIPVYRESRKIMETFNSSIALLNKGEQILIFPDIQYNEDSHDIGEIYTGFMHLEKLYYKSNNTHLAFVPLSIDKTSGTITNRNSIYFDEDKSYEAEKDIVVRKIIDSINL